MQQGSLRLPWLTCWRARARSLLSQELGAVTLRVLSRPGRISQAGHVMTIVRNVAGPAAADEVGRIRLLQDKKTGQEVCRHPSVLTTLQS